MIEYYGYNDFRDYHLAHRGVVGMHWGIRRYQPYGQGGYVRIGGKKGKVLGAAKREQKKFYKYLNSTTDKEYEKSDYAKRLYDKASESRSKYVEAQKPIREFNALSNKEKWDYADKAAVHEWKTKLAKQYKNATPKEIKELQNNLRTSYREDNHDEDIFDTYCRERGMDSTTVHEHIRKTWDAYKNDRDAIVEDALGKYMKKPIHKYRKPGDIFIKTGTRGNAYAKAILGFYALDDNNVVYEPIKIPDNYSYWPKLKWD